MVAPLAAAVTRPEQGVRRVGRAVMMTVRRVAGLIVMIARRVGRAVMMTGRRVAGLIVMTARRVAGLIVTTGHPVVFVVTTIAPIQGPLRNAVRTR